MLKTFNCGIGMVVVADPDRVPELIAAFTARGDRAAVIGSVTDGAGVSYRGRLF